MKRWGRETKSPNFQFTHQMMGCPTDADPGRWDPCVVAETRQIHMDYRVLWRKRDSRATLSREERLNPCLDRLLLLFWAHYIENDPHLLCSVSWVTENKGEDVANYIKKGYLQM